jgi:hypothetical protein
MADCLHSSGGKALMLEGKTQQLARCPDPSVHEPAPAVVHEAPWPPQVIVLPSEQLTEHLFILGIWMGEVPRKIKCSNVLEPFLFSLLSLLSLYLVPPA